MKRQRQDIPVTELLSALSEPVRLRVLRLLETEELSVGEIARVVQLPQSTVSRHLKVLTDGQWLTKRSAGTMALYRVVHDDLSMAARSLWTTVRPQLGDSTELQEDSRRLQAVLLDRRMDSQAFFGRVAGEWDDLRARLFGSDFTASALLSLLPRGWTVADLGCGTGNASELLAPHAERVIAIDQSEPMLEAAAKRLEPYRNVSFLPGQLERLPLKDASVDAAVSALVLHHVQEPARAIAEMRRILRTNQGGGVGLVIDMIEHDREDYRHTMGHAHLGFDPGKVQRMFRDAGFSTVESHVLTSDPEAKGPGLFVATGRIA